MPDPEGDASRGLYGISVAAELVGLDPQSLRLYESRGLLRPSRTDGGTRRYSADDLATLRRITELVATGVNLAGVAAVLRLEADNGALTQENGALSEENDRLRARLRPNRRA